MPNEIFKQICSEFTRLKFVIKDRGGKDSIQIFFSEALTNLFVYNKQVGTVQFMGPQWMRPRYDNIEVRFYLKPFKLVKLDDLFEACPHNRNYKQNGINPYYHYNINTTASIQGLFNAMHEKLKANLGDLYETLEIPILPESINELPRD